MIDAIKHEITAAGISMDAGKSQVDEGVILAGQARDSLNKIKNESLHTAEMIREISAATKEQSEASNEIARNVETIAQMTEHNSAVVTEVSNSAVHLEQMSSSLQNMAHRFKL